MRFSTPLVSSVSIAAFVVVLLSTQCTQKLRPELLEHIRRGTDARITTPVVVPLIGPQTIPIVNVLINGRGPYRMLIDAGANVVSLRQSVAAEAGATIQQRLSKRSVVLVRSMDMGGYVFRNVYAVGEPVLDVDGVIGFNVFREGLLTLDYGNRRLTWGPGELPPPNGRDVIAYELRERMPYIKADVGGVAVWINLDTGAEAPLIFPIAALQTLRLASPVSAGPAVWNQAVGQAETKEARLEATLQFGAHSIERPRVLFMSSLDEYLMGSGLLRDYTVTFDTKNRRVRIARGS